MPSNHHADRERAYVRPDQSIAHDPPEGSAALGRRNLLDGLGDRT